MSVSWDAVYETGNVAIDLQHRQLLAIVDGLEAAEITSHSSRETIMDVLCQLMDFNQLHFAMEEELMTSVGYPSAPRREMITQHRAFTAAARAQVLEFRVGRLSSVLPLKAMLLDWLVEHEFGLDRLLADFIRDCPDTAAGES